MMFPCQVAAATSVISIVVTDVTTTERVAEVAAMRGARASLMATAGEIEVDIAVEEAAVEGKTGVRDANELIEKRPEPPALFSSRWCHQSAIT